TLLTAAGEVMVLAMGTMFKGAALAEQGHTEDGLALLRQGWSALQAIGSRMLSSEFLLIVTRVYGGMGRAEEGLAAIAEAEVFITESEERWDEAELYRLKGELMLQHLNVPSPEFKVPSRQHPTSRLQTEAEAEPCFLKAIDIARQQQAKSWELRAAT